ncbi:hypothetical protein B296_00030012 [Ensete ventricosum]|uniref:Uncharacterized protein n=1 Tax=Ensete ventricosum TaxID=4639 RepID=A0A426Z577_ENSVE|nr:hypothetical protein B296_00030012 [Ensete ventricosum]
MAGTNGAAVPLEDEDAKHKAGWWTILRWIADVLLLPCKSAVFRFPPCGPHAERGAAVGAVFVTGTILCRPHENDRRVTLCLQEGGPAAAPLLVLDLPIGRGELAEVGRVALECDRHWAGAGVMEPLLAAPRWVVHCNGRRAGFGSPRAATGTESRALEAVRVVSAGVGVLPPSKGDEGCDGELLTYLRGL